MDKRVKQTLYLVLAMIIVFPIIIYLAMGLPSNIKGFVHMGVSAVFLVLLFRVWASFKDATKNQWMLSALIAIGFAVALPVGIELVQPLPVSLKGVAHFALVFLFVGLFIRVWLDPRKRPRKQNKSSKVGQQ